MKIKETFVIKVTRTREVIEQCHDEVFEDVKGDIENSKKHIASVLEKEGFKVSEGGFISANVTSHSM